MRTKDEAAAIRAEVEALVGRRGRGNPYPEDLRRRVVEYFHVRRKQKVSQAKIGLETGIGLPTLRYWTSSKRPYAVEMTNVGFERLQIIETSPQPAPSRIVVRGPAGLCIEGLDIDSLAELIRRLS